MLGRVAAQAFGFDQTFQAYRKDDFVMVGVRVGGPGRPDPGWTRGSSPRGYSPPPRQAGRGDRVGKGSCPTAGVWGPSLDPQAHGTGCSVRAALGAAGAAVRGGEAAGARTAGHRQQVVSLARARGEEGGRLPSTLAG